MLNKLQMQIKSLERHYGIHQRVMILGTDDLNQCSDDKLKAYLEYLRNDGQELNAEPEPKRPIEARSLPPEIMEADIPDIESSDIPETPPLIAVAPAIQEPDLREKELDELIDQLRPLNRCWKIQWARGKKMPMKALLHAATLWLSDDPDDWSAANETIFQFTSPFGNKQLCYRRSEKIAIPELASSKRK